MYIYKGKNPDNGKSIEREFSDKDEAEAYALHEMDEFWEYEIIKKPSEGEEDEEEGEYDEDAILNDMGLDDEETNQGFDVDDFFETDK
jgi:hypothetical protein